MNALTIAAYVRQNGHETQIIEECGDAENGPALFVSGKFKRLGPLFLYEDKDGVALTANIPRSRSAVITLLDTMSVNF